MESFTALINIILNFKYLASKKKHKISVLNVSLLKIMFKAIYTTRIYKLGDIKIL